MGDEIHLTCRRIDNSLPRKEVKEEYMFNTDCSMLPVAVTDMKRFSASMFEGTIFELHLQLV